MSGAGLNRLAWLLLALTALRMAWLVLPAPITGYANNLDFFRESACVGAWQIYPGTRLVIDHPSEPVDAVTRTDRREPSLCLPSTDNVFLQAAASAASPGETFPLRRVGALRLLAALAAAAAVLALPLGARSRLFAAIGFALCFGDIAILTYFNTLYTDASVLIPATALALLLCRVAAAPARAGWGAVLLAALLLLWLGGAKEQAGPLAILLGLLLAATLRRKRAKAAILLAASAAGLLWFTLANDGGSAIARQAERVNRADTVFAAILPAAPDQISALRQLGLPADCAGLIGQDGYAPGLRDASGCPAIDRFSRLTLLPLFVSQPQTLLVPLRESILRSRPAYLELAHYSAPDQGGTPRIVLIRRSSLSIWLAHLPTQVYALAAALACLLALPGLLLWFAATLRGAFPPAEITGLALGAALVAYALVSSVFGDGYTELPRHAALSVPGFVLLGQSAVSLATRLARLAAQRRVIAPPPALAPAE